MSRTTTLCLVTALVVSGCGGSNHAGEAVRAERKRLTPFSTPVLWTNTNNVSVNGSVLTKTGGNAWDGGAASAQALRADGYVEFSTQENNRSKMVGLSHVDANHSWTDIDHGFYLTSNGMVYLMYAGSFEPVQPTTYEPGDTFRILHFDKRVYFYINNVLHFERDATELPLRLDTSLFGNTATVSNATIGGDAVFADVVGLEVQQRDLRKTGGDGWTAGASSTIAFYGDGTVEFSTAENRTNKMAGLSQGDQSQTYSDIDFALYLDAEGGISVFENGANRGYVGSYDAGDQFAVQRAGNIVSYYHNQALLYTSTQTPGSPLNFDSSFESKDATLTSVQLTATP